MRFLEWLEFFVLFLNQLLLLFFLDFLSLDLNLVLSLDRLNLSLFPLALSIFIKREAALVAPSKDRMPVRPPNSGVALLMNVFLILRHDTDDATRLFLGFRLLHVLQIWNLKLLGFGLQSLIHHLDIIRVDEIF